MKLYGITAAGLALYMTVAYVAGTMLGLHSPDIWIFRGVLALLGLIAAGCVIWLQLRSQGGDLKQAMQSGNSGSAGGEGGDEIDLVARDAEGRLAGSKVGRAAKLGQLPAVFVVGAPGSAKTTTVVHSGMEPELLSGQVYQDNAIAPTRSANFWFGKQTIFVDASGNLLNDPGRWAKLVRRLAPGKLAAVGSSEQAPRAAVVCFDCEDFVKPGAADAVPAAVRTLQARLNEISQLLGISFPVYVMFTKCDRLPFFLDYVRNLTADEVNQVVGVTLPIPAGQNEGVYADQATAQLTEAFNNLYFALAQRRLDFLAREHAAEKLPGTYEFPREFRKLRTSVVQFLVDLCKPSQLRSAPFLRGFYFSGVRPVMVEDIVAVQAAPQASAQSGSATGYFRPGQQPAAPAGQSRGTRRAPQWVFLSQFFNGVLLADRNAMGASGASVKTSTMRRVLLASAAGLSLLLSLIFFMSFMGNRSLESRVLEAARGINGVTGVPNATPSAETLKRVDTLRDALVTLTDYERNGAPLHLRWGLYTGSDLYPEVRRAYFHRAYHPVLFGDTQAAMLDSLRRLPANPGPNDPYRPVYDTLKAYLITTSEYKRSTVQFLSPYLLSRWAENRGLETERTQLARKQFDFYSEELKAGNPFGTENDTLAIERARKYLKSFNADERIYQALVDAASKKYPAVRMYPNEVVFDPREVKGAFTKDGWGFMQAAFKKPDQFFGGEEWVLGPQTYSNMDTAQLEQKLRGYYYRDFVKEWREFMKAATVARYANLADAAKKLGVLSSGQSPLLGLVCLVSQHTDVDAPEIKAAFDAPQRVVLPACQQQYIGPQNQAYMGSLLSLQSSVQQAAATQPPNEAVAQQTVGEAQKALLTTGQMAQTFKIDREADMPRVVKAFIEEPITQVNALLRGMGPAELKAKAGGMCGQFRELMAKYPFNPKSTVQASVDDVNRFFRPADGTLWQFYQQSLQKLLEKQGAAYVQKADATMKVTPQFLAFFNRAAAFANAAYPGGVQQPKLNYALKTALAGTNQSIALTLDGQTLNVGSGQAGGKQFAWPGNPAGAFMTVKFGGEGFNWPKYDGLWAAFEFFGDSEERQAAGNVYTLEWTLRTGQAGRPVTTTAGQPVTVRFDLDMMGAPPIFRKGYFSGFACVSDVAR